jgi:hypothetical protein
MPSRPIFIPLGSVSEIPDFPVGLTIGLKRGEEETF